jgi:hypothetical protein
MARNVSYNECLQNASEMADSSPGGVTLHMDNLEFVFIFEAIQAQRRKDPRLDKVIDGLNFTFHREVPSPYDQGNQ